MIIIKTEMTEMPKSCMWSEDNGSERCYKRCRYCNTNLCEIEKRFNGYLKVNDPRPDWCPLQEINDKEIETLMMVKEIFGKIEKYLVDLANEYLNMPSYRKYEPANVQVYNHIRTEIDDLEKLKAKYIKEN